MVFSLHVNAPKKESKECHKSIRQNVNLIWEIKKYIF